MLNNSNNSENSLLLNFNFQFLNTKIPCGTHKNKNAQTVCIDCRKYCCMEPNCAQPHLLHLMENLDYITQKHIFPMLNNLSEINSFQSENFKKKYIPKISAYKKNLKSFACEEKNKIDQEYRKILSSLQLIYNNRLESINEYIDILDKKFDLLNEKLHQSFSMKDERINSANITVNDILNSCRNSNEVFISRIAQFSKSMSAEILNVKNNIKKFDFDNAIEEIKNFADKQYTKIEKMDFFSKLNISLKDEETKLISFDKEESGRKTKTEFKRMTSSINEGFDIEPYNVVDLDILVRNIYTTINFIRNNPNEAKIIINKFVDMILKNDDYKIMDGSNYSTINDITKPLQNQDLIYDYINKVNNNKKKILKPYEWDNDLSNSADDYLKSQKGSINSDENIYLSNMKDIIHSYYTGHDNIYSLVYKGSSDLNKIITTFFSNKKFYFEGKNFIFEDIHFNNIGLGGIFEKGNKIILIINLSYIANNN